MAKFEKAYKIITENEGGYQNNPNDNGNYYQGVLIGTNRGISAPVLASFLHRSITKQDMLNLTEKTAKDIYKQKYWENFDKIKNQNVANIIFDGIVNQGHGGMQSVLQKSFKHFGVDIAKSDMYKDEGAKQMNKLNSKKFFEQVKIARKNRYLATNNPEFAKGWIRRINTFYYDGLPLSKTQIIIIGASTSVMLVPLVILGVHLYKKYKN